VAGQGVMVRTGLRILAAAATIIAAATFSSTHAHAQEPEPKYTISTAFLPVVNYNTPLRWTFGGALFHSHRFEKEGGGGVIAGGTVGQHGMQAWGGLGLMTSAGGGDLRAVVTRTFENPRGGASANSTYVGGEVGWGMGLRLSLGYAKQIAGPSTGKDHVITWGIGMELPLWWRERARDTAGTHNASSARASSLSPRPAP